MTSAARLHASASTSRWVTRRHAVRPQCACHHTAFAHGSNERWCICLRAEDDDVRLNFGRVDLDAFNVRQSLCEQPGVRMIFMQPLRHLLQRDQASGGQNARLPHASAHRLTQRTCPADVLRCGLRAATPTGAHRPFERQKLTVSKPRVSVATSVFSAAAALKTRAPSRWMGRPRSCAPAASSPMTCSGVTVPPAMLCVFSIHTRPVCCSIVEAAGRKRRFNVFPAQNSALTCHRPQLAAGERWLPCPSPSRARARAIRRQTSCPCCVCRRSAIWLPIDPVGTKMAASRSKISARSPFQLVDRGIFAVDVITHIGRCHSGTHLGSGFRHGYRCADPMMFSLVILLLNVWTKRRLVRPRAVRRRCWRTKDDRDASM